jgi:ceramide glucosyltransferase
MLDWILYIPAILAGLSFAYVNICIVALLLFRERINAKQDWSHRLPITVLKPICGMETNLAENLRSFCRQDYDQFQVIFGVHGEDDKAIPIIRALIEEFPERDLSLVIDDTIIGSNYKVSNLANMFGSARHDIIVVADSDMRVCRDYLKAVVAPFKDPQVGAATCVYSGRAAGKLPSKLGALFINDWFLPSALIPAVFGRLTYCFGATMAIRRSNLEQFGSFNALANVLADDFMFGRLVHQQGHRVALIPYIVENVIEDPSLKSLFLHELRWARTIRSVEPLGYAASAITEIMPLAAIAAVCLYVATGSFIYAGGIFAIAAVLRLALHYTISSTVSGRGTAAPLLVPLRDVMSPIIRLSSYFGRKVTWRERDFVIHSNVRLEVAE